MNIKRAIHTARHNVCVQVRLEKAVPTPKGVGNPKLKFWKIVLEALKRDDPKEMADEYVNGYGNLKGECPSCHCTMMHPAKYCKFCGQRLKWREDDE